MQSHILRGIAAYLQEHKLNKTLETLKEETGVLLNTSLKTPGTLTTNIEQGRWDSVLSDLLDVHVHVKLMRDLYEHIFFELLEQDAVEAAHELLRRSEVFAVMRESGEGERYIRLESALSEAKNHPEKNLIAKETLTKQRVLLAKKFKDNLEVIQPGYLESLFTKCNDTSKKNSIEPNTINTVALDEIIHATNVPEDAEYKTALLKLKMSIPGLSLVTFVNGLAVFGMKNGRVIVWKPSQGHKALTEILDKNRKDPKLPAFEITCMDCSLMENNQDVEICVLVAGNKAGQLVFFNLDEGNTLNFWKSCQIHHAPVVSVKFIDEKTVLSADQDRIIRKVGIKSGRVLEELKLSSSCKELVRLSSENFVLILDEKWLKKLNITARGLDCHESVVFDMFSKVKFLVQTDGFLFVSGTSNRILKARAQEWNFSWHADLPHGESIARMYASVKGLLCVWTVSGKLFYIHIHEFTVQESPILEQSEAKYISISQTDNLAITYNSDLISLWHLP